MFRHTLVFFGEHSEDWITTLLSSQLLSLLKKHGIRSIKHVTDAGDLRWSPTLHSVIPLLDKHATRLHQEISPGSWLAKRIIAPSPPAIKAFAHKQLFSAYIQQHSLEHLTPRHFHSIQDFQESGIQHAISKPDTGSSGVGCRILESGREADGSDDTRGKMVIQEYIPGDQEWVTHAIANQGRVTKQVTYLYHLPDPVCIKTFGVKCPAERVPDAPVKLDVLEQFLMPLNYTGVCCFNYKISIPDQQLKVLEINPRMGGSLMHGPHINDLVSIIGGLLELGSTAQKP